MKQITEQERKELAIAEEQERKKGFFKDLFWGLLGYSALFCGVGLVILYAPDAKASHYFAYAMFFFAVVLDAVCIVSYIQYDPKKKSNAKGREKEDQGYPEEYDEKSPPAEK